MLTPPPLPLLCCHCCCAAAVLPLLLFLCPCHRPAALLPPPSLFRQLFVVMLSLPPPCCRLRATVAVPLPRWCCRSAAPNTALLPPCWRCRSATAANALPLLTPPYCCHAAVAALLPPLRCCRCPCADTASAVLPPPPPLCCSRCHQSAAVAILLLPPWPCCCCRHRHCCRHHRCHPHPRCHCCCCCCCFTVALAVAVIVAKECAIHTAMERFLNGSCVGVNVPTRPRGATDLNAIEEHWAEPIVFHPDKSSRENMAIRQGRTIESKNSNHGVVCHNVDQKYICRFLSFWSCPVYFLLNRFGRKTDWHILFWSMFSKFFMYLGFPKVAYRKGLSLHHELSIISTTMNYIISATHFLTLPSSLHMPLKTTTYNAQQLMLATLSIIRWGNDSYSLTP